MPLPGNANRVVVRGRWYAERSGGGSGLTIQFTPLPLTGTVAPNVTDLAAYSWIKTQAATVTPDAASAYFAVALLANDDPDLTAFGGWRVTPQGETPFTIAVPAAAPLVQVDADMRAAIPELVVGEQVQAIWLTEAALVGVTLPPAPASFYTADQTRSVVATAIDEHDVDPQAHPDIRALAEPGGGGSGASQLVVSRTAAIALSGHRVVTPVAGGLVYASNATASHTSAPLWLTSSAVSAGAAALAVAAGPVTEPSWSWTPGPVYLGTNGLLTQTPPTAAGGAVFSAQIGYAVTATELHVDRAPSIRLA